MVETRLSGPETVCEALSVSELLLPTTRRTYAHCLASLVRGLEAAFAANPAAFSRLSAAALAELLQQNDIPVGEKSIFDMVAGWARDQVRALEAEAEAGRGRGSRDGACPQHTWGGKDCSVPSAFSSDSPASSRLEPAGSEGCSVKPAPASDSGTQLGAVLAHGGSLSEGCEPPRLGNGNVPSSSLERDGRTANSSGVDDGDSGEPEEHAMCHEEGSLLEGWRQEVEAQVLRVLGMIR